MQHLRIILIFETIILLRHLCIAKLCPVLVGNAVLSSTCSRKIGVSCSFSCTQGHRSTTMDNIVCTSDGTWNLKPTILCPHELGPFLSKEKAALYLQGRAKRVKRDINEECREYGSCSNEEIKEIGVTDVCAWMKNRLCSQLNCPAGYMCVTTVNNCANLNYYRVACQAMFCPVPVGNAVLSSTCSRQTGVSCPFFCTQGHHSTTMDNIVCTSDGTWSLNTTTLCSPILCPKSVDNAVMSPNCSRMVGKSCTYSCTHGYLPTTSDSVVCTPEGSWNNGFMDTNALCSPIFCPVPVGNAVLSAACSRHIGVSCSFSCNQGHHSTTLDNIVCTSDGTWSLNTTTLCSPILCPKSVGNAVMSPNCSRTIGKSCTYSCTHGYLPTTSDSVVCTSEGSWNIDFADTNALCSPIFCPVPVGNAVLSATCSRHIGVSCSFSCNQGHHSTTLDNLVCTSDGTWSLNTTTLCSPIHCPLDDVINGNISSSCQGLIGEKCYVICDSSINTVDIVCLSSGSWDEDTTAICSLKNESESSSLKTSRPNMMFLYAGTSVAGTLFVVIIIVGVTCLIKRRGNTTRNINHGMPSDTENRPYFESVNSAYEEPIQHVYSEI